LYFILPPNLDEALGRGKLMVVLEAKWAKQVPAERSAERPSLFV
jgi:hypothetical protein